MGIYTEILVELCEDQQSGDIKNMFFNYMKFNMNNMEGSNDEVIITLESNVTNHGDLSFDIEKHDLIDLAEAILKHYK